MVPDAADRANKCRGGGDATLRPNVRILFRLAAAASGLPAMPQSRTLPKGEQGVASVRHLVHHLHLGECRAQCPPLLQKFTEGCP